MGLNSWIWTLAAAQIFMEVGHQVCEHFQMDFVLFLFTEKLQNPEGF